MNEGDLVIWTGKQTETSTLKNRVIYQVMKKTIETTEGLLGGKSFTSTRLHLRVVYDIGQPMGVHINTSSWSEHELKKLSLVDLGIIRMTFDNFIREYARLQGMEDVTDDEVPGA